MFKNQTFSKDKEGYIVFSNNRKKYFTRKVHIFILYNEYPELLEKKNISNIDHKF